MLLTIAYVIDFERHIPVCGWHGYYSVDKEVIVLLDVVYCLLNIVRLFYACGREW